MLLLRGTASDYNIPWTLFWFQVNFFEPLWSSELYELKEASYNAHQLWIVCDKLNSGLVNELSRQSKYKYKLASRQEELQVDDEISQMYCI